MLINLKQIAASVCPNCSNAAIYSLSVFNFSGGKSLKITCPTKNCGCECVNILPKGKKFKINIHCPYCGSVHTHTIDFDQFWNKDLISFPCPEVGIPAFFLGKYPNVENTLNQTLGQYSALYQEAMDELCAFDYNEYEDFDDILYDIMDTIHELRDEGALSCICGSESVSINTVGQKILLSCPRCRRSKVIEATEENLAMIMNATAIVLGK